MTLFESIYENNKETIEHIQSLLKQKMLLMPDNNYKKSDEDSFLNHIESHEAFENILNDVKKELKVIYDNVEIWETDHAIKLNSNIVINLNHNFNSSNIIHKNICIVFSSKESILTLVYDFYNDYNCALSTISFKDKNGLCFLGVNKDSVEIKIPNDNTCYDSYKLENNHYTFKEGSTDEFIFEDNFAEGEDSKRIAKTVNFLNFCFNDQFIKDSYLDYIFLDNIIKKNPIPQEIQDFFSLKYDKKIEDHSSFFSFNPLERFNILKKENSFVNIFKKTIPTFFKKTK